MNTLTLSQPAFSKRCDALPSSFIRDILKVTSQRDVISFAGGLPDAQLFPFDELEESASAVFQNYGPKVLQYSESEGLKSLRSWICDFYQNRYQMEINPEQVLITNGSQQALDLIGKAFIDADDQVILEQPSYLGAIQAFMVYEPEILPVAIEQDGLNIDRLEELLRVHKPKLLYLVSNFQNPSGYTLSLEKRKKLADLAETYGLTIVEDDPYGMLRYEGSDLPPLRYFTPQSILCGSFSKIMAPGFRLGWVIAEEPIIQKLLILKQASDLHSNNLSQYITDHYLRHYDLSTHIDKLRQHYGQKCQMMYEAFNRALPSTCRINKSAGGMFLWIELPEYMDAEALLHETMQSNVVFVPGKYFFTNGKGHNTLRVNFTNSSEASIHQGVAIIAQAVRKLLITS